VAAARATSRYVAHHMDGGGRFIPMVRIFG